jgi:Family of unknown function (DUF5681)
MPEYEVGYGKPPRASQFKPGVSGNRKGRPKRQKSDLASVIHRVMYSFVRHRENGQEQITPAWELNLKLLVRSAVSGDVDAATAVLKFWAQAERTKSGKQRVVVEDWLPDYAGQTAEQKTRDFARKRNAAAIEWWSQAGTARSKNDQGST